MLRPTYLAYMAVAGIIAAFGVTRARVRSSSSAPWPSAPTSCRSRLPASRSSGGARACSDGRPPRLASGLAVAIAAALSVTLFAALVGYVPDAFDLDEERLSRLASVGRDTVSHRPRRRRRRYAQLRDTRQLRGRRRHLGDDHPGGRLHGRRRRPGRVARRPGRWPCSPSTWPCCCWRSPSRRAPARRHGGTLALQWRLRRRRPARPRAPAAAASPADGRNAAP